jgi:hypothetical protein
MAKKTKNPNATQAIRIGQRNYELLTDRAKKNGHSLLWLLNYIVDLWFQEEAKK